MFQDTGALKMMEAYYNNDFPTSKDLTLKLFTNNITPADTDTAATYTIAAGGGYANKTIANASWTVAMDSNIATATYAQQTYTFTGALTDNATVYGYYCVDDDNDVIFSGLLSSPFTPANNGDSILITPKFQLSKGTVS